MIVGLHRWAPSTRATSTLARGRADQGAVMIPMLYGLVGANRVQRDEGARKRHQNHDQGPSEDPQEAKQRRALRMIFAALFQLRRRMEASRQPEDWSVALEALRQQLAHIPTLADEHKPPLEALQQAIEADPLPPVSEMLDALYEAEDALKEVYGSQGLLLDRKV